MVSCRSRHGVVLVCIGSTPKTKATQMTINFGATSIVIPSLDNDKIVLSYTILDGSEMSGAKIAWLEFCEKYNHKHKILPRVKLLDGVVSLQEVYNHAQDYFGDTKCVEGFIGIKDLDCDSDSGVRVVVAEIEKCFVLENILQLSLQDRMLLSDLVRLNLRSVESVNGKSQLLSDLYNFIEENGYCCDLVNFDTVERNFMVDIEGNLKLVDGLYASNN